MNTPLVFSFSDTFREESEGNKGEIFLTYDFTEYI